MLKKIILLCLNLYSNTLSNNKLKTCRFRPTCSEYMKEAIEKKGVLKGGIIGIKRILRCNPLVPGGFDPVK